MADAFRFRFSAIAHARLPYCNPIAPEKLERVLDLLSGQTGLRALDVGCGRADLLALLAERFAATGIGLDLSELFLDEGRRRLAARCPDAAIDLIRTDIADYPVPAEPFDLVACVGGPFERIETAWQHLGRFLRPGGFLLWGGPYWQQAPADAYLAFLGLAADHYATHAANVLDGEGLGLVPLYATVASPDDWDHYEGTYAGSIERHLLDHPDDPDADAMRQRLRPWREAYLRWGRGTLGFGLYLFAWPG